MNANPNWTEIVTAIATAVLAFAALVALGQLRQARHARYAVAATEAARRWDDPTFRHVRSVVAKHRVEGGPNGLRDEMLKFRRDGATEYFEFLTILDYFEDLRILIKSRAISFRIVDDSLGTTVVQYWSTCKPFVMELRKQLNDNRAYENFETLAVKISKKHGYSVLWQPSQGEPGSVGAVVDPAGSDETRDPNSASGS